MNTLDKDIAEINSSKVWAICKKCRNQDSKICKKCDGAKYLTDYPRYDTEHVNHPKHYQKGGLECIDVIKAATDGLTGIEAFCIGNSLKYQWRWKEKNGIEDLKKARWYLDYLIGLEET